jgi:hypothetical protein
MTKETRVPKEKKGIKAVRKSKQSTPCQRSFASILLVFFKQIIRTLGKPKEATVVRKALY